MQMIKDAKDKKFNMIITREVSRFARNTVDTLQYTRLMKEYGVEVFFINDNIKTFDGDGELRLTIMATLAQDESRKTSIRVKAGQETSMKNGVFYGTGNILGYDRKGKEMVINEEQAKTVRMIYDMYLSGMGVTSIQYELEKAGRLTATGKTKWHASYLSHTPKNSFYCGIITYHKEYTPDYLKQKKSRIIGINLIEMRAEGDIDKDLFRELKQEIEKRIAELTEEIKTLQPDETKQSPQDYVKKLQELRERLKEYTGFDYSVIPESVVEAFIGKIWVSKDEFRWYLRSGKSFPDKFDLDNHIQIASFTLTIDDAKKYLYSFSTRRRVYNWKDLNVSVWI